MTTEFAQAFDKYPVIKEYFSMIPKDLWYIFIPAHIEEFDDFSRAIKRLRTWEEDREFLIKLQKKYNLPLRPNERMNETTFRVVKERNRRKLDSKGPDLPFDNNSSEDCDH